MPRDDPRHNTALQKRVQATMEKETNMFHTSAKAGTARGILAALLTTIPLAIAAPVVAQQKYTLTDIGQGSYDILNGQTININASGYLAGFYEDANGNNHAWIWNPTSANSATGTYSLL